MSVARHGRGGWGLCVGVEQRGCAFDSGSRCRDPDSGRMTDWNMERSDDRGRNAALAQRFRCSAVSLHLTAERMAQLTAR